MFPPGLLLALSLISADPALARVWGVHDGDTIQVTDERGALLTVRLVGVDAPELAQLGGPEARDWLKGEILRHKVRLVDRGRDRYGRLLADVWVGDRWINADLVGSGHAWQFVRYDRGPVLRHIEGHAREARRGIWADEKPEPPWEFRRPKKAEPAL